MTNIRAFVKRHPVLSYYVLTFAISGSASLLVIGTTGSIPPPDAQADSLAPVIAMALVAGTSISGLVLTGLVDGRAGFRELLSRLLRWRVGARWYAVALLTAPLLATAILLSLSYFSPEFLPAIVTADDKAGLLLQGILAGLAGALCEEIGWTGFAIPRLRLKHGVLATGLFMGLLWGVWHFPPFWRSNTFSELLPLAVLLWQLFSWLPPYRVLMVWVYDHTESLLLATLMHASIIGSVIFVLVPASLTGVSLLIWYVSWSAALWVVVGAVALVGRRQPSRQQLQRQAA